MVLKIFSIVDIPILNISKYTWYNTELYSDIYDQYLVVNDIGEQVWVEFKNFTDYTSARSIIINEILY